MLCPWRSTDTTRWIAAAGAVLLVAVAADSLVPVAFQVRLGLHWLIEHFLAYFAVTFLLLPRLAAAVRRGGGADGARRARWRPCKA